MGVRRGRGGSGNVGERVGEEERGKRDKGRGRREIWLRTHSKSNAPLTHMMVDVIWLTWCGYRQWGREGTCAHGCVDGHLHCVGLVWLEAGDGVRGRCSVGLVCPGDSS